jgi:predicted Fe-Mo cluster-binding NifX family protein
MNSGRLCQQLEQCRRFAFFDVDLEAKAILGYSDFDASAQEPSMLARWLVERDAELVIAGGVPSRVEQLLSDQGISVVAGAPTDTPTTLVRDYLAGTLGVRNKLRVRWRGRDRSQMSPG